MHTFPSALTLIVEGHKNFFTNSNTDNRVETIVMMKLRLCIVSLAFVVFKFGIDVGAVTSNPDDVGFYFFPDPSNTSKANQIVYNNNASLAASLFNCTLEVKILVHGFGGRALEEIVFPGNVKKAYLSQFGKFPCNVISVDYEKLATADCPGGGQNTPCLLIASENARIVGERIGLFIVWVQAYCKLDLKSFHAVGHSLGSHVAGLAGSTVIQKTGSQIGRLSTLDPIGSSTYLFPFQIQPLSKDDAVVTDMYHTSLPFITETPATADLTLLVNGGLTPQPGCFNVDAGKMQGCSHERSCIYFEMSIRNPQSVCATKLSNFFLLNPGCDLTFIYGEHCDPRTTGTYLVPYPPP